jgi:3',5'-cyclic AMP phosphodiesterase CpdA
MRLAHLSDLHFGHHDEAVAATLARELEAQGLDLVVISGDFTQRGTPSEFQAAKAFIDTLSVPVFTVPGNHDVPQNNLARRFLAPYGLYRRYINPNLEPFLELKGIALAGIKTVHRAMPSLNWAQGSFGRNQLGRLEGRFAQTSPDAIRVIVAHHPLLIPEENIEVTMGPVHRANLALQTFADIGVRLVLSGHYHLTYVRRHERPGTITDGAPDGLRKAATAPILIAQASSTISTRLRGHANAYNLIDIKDGEIAIAVREWKGGTWATMEKAKEPVPA